MARSVLTSALGYVAQGRSVIPLVPRDKVPLVLWKVWQTRRPTPPQCEAWWRTWPAANLGVVCGPISGLSVVDYDPRNDPGGATGAWVRDRLGKPSVRTGSGGRHWYLEDGLPTIHGLRVGLDLIGDKGFVVAPPSVTTAPYVWADEAVRPIPVDLLEHVRRVPGGWTPNDRAYRLAHDGAAGHHAATIKGVAHETVDRRRGVHR